MLQHLKGYQRSITLIKTGRLTVIASRSGERRHVAVTSRRVPLLNADSAIQTHSVFTTRRRICVSTFAHINNNGIPVLIGFWFSVLVFVIFSVFCYVS